jgi:hypothetical protein
MRVHRTPQSSAPLIKVSQTSGREQHYSPERREGSGSRLKYGEIAILTVF